MQLEIACLNTNHLDPHLLGIWTIYRELLRAPRRVRRRPLTRQSTQRPARPIASELPVCGTKERPINVFYHWIRQRKT